MFEISGLLLYVRCHFPSVLRVAHKGPASNGDNYCDGVTLGAIIENIFLPREITLFVIKGKLIISKKTLLSRNLYQITS